MYSFWMNITFIVNDTKISQVDLSAFIYRLFHEDFSSIIRINTLVTPTMCDSRAHLNYMFLPREAVGDSNDRGWFLGINHGHVTYFSL